MASIIDDFNTIYNEIVNDIVEKKKQKCADPDVTENINCSNVYHINTNAIDDDIEFRFKVDDTIITTQNIESYIDSIKYKAGLFIKNNLYNDDNNNIVNISRENLNNINSYEFRTHIDSQILLFKSSSDNYDTLNGILKTTSFIIICLLFKRYIYDYVIDVTKVKTICSIDEYILDGLSLISIIYLSFYVIINTIENNKNNSDIKINKLENIKKEDISEMNECIKDLYLVDNDNIANIKNYIRTIIKNYKKIEFKNLTNNRYSKHDKIKNMKTFFDEIKQIILINDNKFADTIVNNHDQVICLMKMITLKGDKALTECLDDSTTVCNFNVNCGFRGLVNDQYYDHFTDLTQDTFKNGLDEIIDTNDNKIDEFFDYIQNNVIDSSIRFSIKNSPVFKIINNMFLFKIKYYGIKKIQFTKFIYKHFENHKSSKINKSDMINNYKTLINMIYENYVIYENINNTNEYLASNLISKHRFSEIIQKYSIDDLLNIINKLEKTIDNIEEFKNIYKEDITREIDIEKNQNKNFLYFVSVICIISFLKSIGYIIMLLNNVNCKGEQINDNNNITLKMLQILCIISVIILINSIIFSHWFKKSVDINFRESTILDSNNKFINKLHDMHEYLNYLYKIKKIDGTNIKELNPIFEKFNIKYYTTSSSILYSKYNSGNNYTILDNSDIVNIITEQLYLKISDVIKIYECCSFLKDEPKKVILPYQEISINIIFIIITLVVFVYIFSDPTLNPVNLFNEILDGNKKMSLNKKINNLKITQNGGNYEAIGGSGQLKRLKTPSVYLIYISTIYLSFKFIHLLYVSNVEYEKSLYR
tara:strand:- start:4312 stop:6771 length:2460 start_codon:yes stop_codon:yes gene_type:complete